MRPVLVTAILLLGVMTFMSDSAAGNLGELCQNSIPAVPCRVTALGEGWFEMDTDRCVKVFYHTDHLYYHDAEAVCNGYRNGDIKGHLVSIHSVNELNQVRCAMYRATTEKTHYWIGLQPKEVLTGLTHTWTDGTPYKYHSWAVGQPDYFSENCIEMIFSCRGHWNHTSCFHRKPYVCAIRV